jgi:hypothetical protein
MRLPKIQQYDKNITKEIVEINDLTFEPKFYDLGKDKDKFKFITTVEKLCRTSMEYYDLINFLRINMGMDFCSFFHKVSKNAYGKTRIKVEIHHEPFTLYDIVAIILNNRLDNNESVDMFDIANEVMECHYEGIVGLLPLSVTVHELVHSGKLFIPLQFIDEGFNIFLNRYYGTIKNMDGLTDMLEAKIRLSKKYAENPDEFIGILKKKYIYVVNDGYDSCPKKLEIESDKS